MAASKLSLLVVDDELDMLETYRSILSKKFNVLTASTGNIALETVANSPVQLVLLDIKMPKMNGLEVLKKLKEIEPGLDVVMVTASKDVVSAVEAMKLGALDYITKPFDVKELMICIEKALEKRELVRENLYLKDALKESSTCCDLMGNTKVMKKLFEAIDRVSPTDSTVLIHGESGTGKELVARAVHQKSRRAEKPFVAVNCAAIPENLLESELFGHEKGSFTGAVERKLGKFELADGGTLFLDEIGCLSSPMQAKLLRVLEDKVIERVGGEKGVPVDIRIISATNIDFEKAIGEGKFRNDLYYRLNVIPLKTPPLRDRKEDIPLLARHFLEKFNREINKRIKGFSRQAMQKLINHDWPGNVRELQNLIERLVVLTSEDTITAEDLPFAGGISNPRNLKESLTEHEKNLITNALSCVGGSRTEAAKILGIPRSTLNSRIVSLRIS